jgi:hypothetical protein
LPGLILKITDSEDLYSFECTGIEKTNKLMYKDKDEDIETVYVSREEFFKIRKRYYENPKAIGRELFERLGLNFNQVLEVARERNIDIPDNILYRYNPMELE